jgi:glycosyltransferase involved in cell wall biosynthesis
MDDVAGLARLMRDVHDDDAVRGKLAAAGRERAARYTWAAAARRLLDHCIEVG